MKFESIFLDRDGVINRERSDYVKSWEEFEFLPGSIEALSKLSNLGVPIIIITNQSAIGRGAANQETINEIHNRLITIVQERGGRIDDIFVCPHRPDEACKCRKPQPGLLLQAAAKHHLNLDRAVFVGDAITDFQAALAAGCACILVKTGRQANQIESLVDSYLQSDNRAIRPDIVDNLYSAIERIISISSVSIAK